MIQMNENAKNILYQLYNNYGENFLDTDYISVTDIQKNTIGILKDIFNERLNLSIYGKFILDDRVLGNMIVVIEERFNYYKYIHNSMMHLRNYNAVNRITDNYFPIVEGKILSELTTYDRILKTLISISETKNVTELNMLGQMLKNEHLIYNLK